MGKFLLGLVTGAVLCDMAPNPLRNFTVFANGIRIKDVGTVFSVMRTVSGVKVTVVAGAVRYSPSGLPLVRNQQAFIAGDQAPASPSSITTVVTPFSRMKDRSSRAR